MRSMGKYHKTPCIFPRETIRYYEAQGFIRPATEEKNGMCRALIDAKNIKVEDIERMVQIASTGSGNLLFVYNWNPPGGVSSISYTGI